MQALPCSITYIVNGPFKENPFLKYRAELIKVGAIPHTAWQDSGDANDVNVYSEFTFTIIPEDYQGYRLTALVNRIIR